MLPTAMQVVEISEPGGPEVLRLVSRPVPEPGPGEVLIRVEAAGVNRADVLQRRGGYRPPPGASDVPGLEVAGTVVRSGPGTPGGRTGDPVCALVAGGGYAEFCLAPWAQCLRWPDGCGAREAAALPEACFTVWTNVFERGRLGAGDVVLVHGGSSGIGTTAIQLAVASGARVLATAGTDEKCAAAVRLGAARAVKRSDDFAAVVAAETGGRGVDVVLDVAGGDMVQRNLDVLAEEGRLVQIAFVAGVNARIDLRVLMTRRLWVTGSTLRSRSAAEKARLADAVRTHVWPHVDSGAVRPVVFAAVPLAEAAEAHRMLESGVVIGKLVLTVP